MNREEKLKNSIGMQLQFYTHSGATIEDTIDRIFKRAIEFAEATSIHNSYQERVSNWMQECFGSEIANDKNERAHRFIEEAIELVQSTGCSKDEVLMLVDYVFNRPIGEPFQEVGGVMVTLAALCSANQLDMQNNAEIELARVFTKIEQIRAKQASKPKSSPLPQ